MPVFLSMKVGLCSELYCTAFIAHTCWTSLPSPCLACWWQARMSPKGTWLTRRPLCNLSAGQGRSTTNPLPWQVRSTLPAVERIYRYLSLWGPYLEWTVDNKEGFEKVQEFPWEKLIGVRKLFEGVKTNFTGMQHIFKLRKQDEVAWGWDRLESREGRRRCFQKSHLLCIASGHPVENRVKTIEDH